MDTDIYSRLSCETQKEVMIYILDNFIEIMMKGEVYIKNMEKSIEYILNKEDDGSLNQKDMTEINKFILSLSYYEKDEYIRKLEKFLKDEDDIISEAIVLRNILIGI